MMIMMMIMMTTFIKQTVNFWSAVTSGSVRCFSLICMYIVQFVWITVSGQILPLTSAIDVMLEHVDIIAGASSFPQPRVIYSLGVWNCSFWSAFVRFVADAKSVALNTSQRFTVRFGWIFILLWLLHDNNCESSPG